MRLASFDAVAVTKGVELPDIRDRIDIDGRLEAKDCTVTYRHGGRKLAVVTIGRDRESLAAETELERAIADRE